MEFRTLFIILPLTLTGCDSANDQHAVGTLEWDRIEVAAQIAEPVLSWDAREGSQIEQGQILLQLDATREWARMEAAQASRDQVQAQRSASWPANSRR